MENTFDRILICIAFSPNLKKNIFEAIRLSNMFNAKLIGVHAGEENKDKSKALQDILKEIPESKNIEIVFKQGSPVKVIVEVCESKKIDLLVLGALQKENIFTYYLGSTARKLTRKAPCSVLLLIKRSVVKSTYKHVVVNGLQSTKTQNLVHTAFCVAHSLACKKITIVEEIPPEIVAINIEDDDSLSQAVTKKEAIVMEEQKRIKGILKNIPQRLSEDVQIKSQSIFGKTGYSIGHYARVVHADLLLMNAPEKSGIWSRIFIRDVEYILSDLPTNLLLIKS